MWSSNKKLRFSNVRLCLALLVGLLGASTALSDDFASHPMRFGHLTLEDGLSQSNVLSILQDSEGMMWFGTENGLNSFDGYEFTHYKRERGVPDALSNDFIFDIAEGQDGNLWIATNGGGLAQFDRATGRVQSFRHDTANPKSIAGNIVRRLLIDDAGRIWVGTRGAGLDRFDPKTGEFEHFKLTADDSSNTIFALLQDSAGSIWVGGDHGLTRFDTDGVVSETMASEAASETSIGSQSVRAVTEDSKGQIWVGTYGGGLSRLDPNTNSFKHFVHDETDVTTISSDRVSSIFEDSDGRLWVGTAQGLNLVDRSTGAMVRYQSDNTDASTLGDNDISSIYEDRSGLLWVGTRSHGVNTWNPRTWYYGFEAAKEISTDGETQPNVMAFIDDGAGTLWVGTFGDGLNAIDRSSGEITKYRSAPDSDGQIADDYVMSLMRDGQGSIWVGTMRRGITRLNPKTGKTTQYRHEQGNPNSLSANGIMTMYEDRDGLVWVGTFGGGISRYNPESGEFKNFTPDSADPYALSGNRITSFAQDANGNMWVGTDGAGLNFMDRETERFHHFRHNPDNTQSLASDTVYSVNIDADHNVWVGTQGGGLDRVVGDAGDPGAITFDNLSHKNGLTNDVIYGIQFDDAGWVWMSTNYGISRFNPDTGEIKNMHRKDGLQSEEFNFGAHYRSESGELFFGGHNGFNAFHPDDIKASTIVPLIALTGFFNGGESTKSDLPVNETETVEISWKDDVVAFEFAAMDFIAPEQNRYMYKLEGFDNDWNDLGNRRRVTYTDLNDGNYLLRVKAANSEGIWNEAGFAMPVRVTAAPWDTWWAYLGYLAVFTQLVFGLYIGHRRKIRREEEYSHRLEWEVESRTERLLDKNKQLRELNQALQESSLSDPLTGLRNRRFVFEEVSRDLDVIQRRLGDERTGVDKHDVSELVFMMIDLDNFKPINDTYGHAAGDEMLLQLRDVLLRICRRSDFVIRWGGDEFVVIAKQTRPDEAEQLAERIRSSVADSNFTLSDGQIVRTTCSIGFAAYPLFRAQADESSLDQIISLADGLMYEAKKKRNAWVGMLGPSEATTSFDYDHDEIESTSLLFRARRAGNLKTFSSLADESNAPARIDSAG
ncbi:MAG: two-component regulator propeller domain-containing protein [Woeseiaceae bacterium]